MNGLRGSIAAVHLSGGHPRVYAPGHKGGRMADNITPDAPEGISPDRREDSRRDSRWLSYDELAEASGIKRESVIRLVRRKRWPKREGNRPGEIRIAVPADILADMRARKEPVAKATPDVPEDIPPDIRPALPTVLPDISRTVSALEAHVTTLQEQLAKAEARGDRAERAGELDRAAAAEERARLLTLVERADVRADREAARADQADARADGAEAELARLQAPPAAIPAPEAEAALVHEDGLDGLDAPDDQLVASMAAEVARARALVPAPTPRRGFLARLLNRKPAAPTL